MGMRDGFLRRHDGDREAAAEHEGEGIPRGDGAPENTVKSRADLPTELVRPRRAFRHRPLRGPDGCCEAGERPGGGDFVPARQHQDNCALPIVFFCFAEGTGRHRARAPVFSATGRFCPLHASRWGTRG
ncbi:hypothetical protein TraAM80_03714 [Trypanosoma rangeli]|uniref:Uncharacterized protein n=1 Tax=Trypanosoma rangeli TaxID=5698 RepID=A0A3R7M0M9_TRYRA|nr:uncharacterized protein TraAM80_03714 [Trypanosoma rangeli]RNF06898.1 hypothetical protein TraAM80_03714 [Trypanosoma rangeli]|eukprot:RNF06898.1 hypothetical protein TraAM80_03714 [Trypanosoma rangeli]